MKKIILTSFVTMLAVVSGLVSSCSSAKATGGAGNVVTRTVGVGKFTKIEASGGVDVYFTPKKSGVPEVEIMASEDVIVYVSIRTVEDVLYVSVNTKNSRRVKITDCRVYIKAAGVNSFGASSSSDIYIEEDISHNEALSLHANSSGDIKTKSLTAPVINMATSSSADIESVNCNGNILNIAASSSGDIEIGKAVVETCNVAASSSSDVEMSVCSAGVLNIAANSSGSVSIDKSTDVPTINISISSTSSVELSSTKSDQINIEAFSGSELEIGGSTANCVVSASSGAELDLSGLKVGSGVVTATSGATVDVADISRYSSITTSSGASVY